MIGSVLGGPVLEQDETTRARSCRYVQMSIFKLSLYGKYYFAVMSQRPASNFACSGVTMQSAVSIMAFPRDQKCRELRN